MALCPECALNMSTPVTFARDRSAYVIDISLATVESTAFTRQGSLVQIQPRPPSTCVKQQLFTSSLQTFENTSTLPV